MGPRARLAGRGSPHPPRQTKPVRSEALIAHPPSHEVLAAEGSIAERGNPRSQDDEITRLSQSFDDAQKYYRNGHERSRNALDFVFKLKHYKDDKGQTLDRTRVQPKGAELFNTIRHKASEIAGQPTYFECWPVDQIDDPLSAEYSKRVIESVLQDPLKRYRPCKRRMVYGGLVASVWYMKAEWDGKIGPFGDIRFSTLSTMHVLPEPGWQDIHDPCCPRVYEWHDLPIDSIKGKQGWKNTKGLWPDNGGKNLSEDDYAKSLSEWSPDEQDTPDTVRVVFVWDRWDDKTEDKLGVSRRALAPQDRYMACLSCGYKTMDVPRETSGELPMQGGMCPVCYQSDPPEERPLERIDYERIDERYLSYPTGRLRIIAPVQRRKFYDGPWPDKMRSFPFFQFRCYENPEEYNGLSDAMLHINDQVILNSLRRMGYEQMRTSKSIIVVAGGPDGRGLLDHRGRPFILSDENGCVAYAQGPTVSNMIQHVQGQGLPAQWTPYYQAILGAFSATQGTSDLGLTPASSKDIAASTVQQLTEMGEIPVKDHLEVINEEEGVFLGVVLDIWKSRVSVPRATRHFGPEGKMIVERLKGTEIPNVDVVVTAQPKMKAAHLEQFKTFAQWASLPPPIRRIAAKQLNIPISMVMELELEEQQMAQQQMMSAQQPQGPSAPGMNGLPSPEMMAGMGAPAPQM